MGVLNLTMERAPTSPKESANDDLTTTIIIVVPILKIGSIAAKVSGLEKLLDCFRYIFDNKKERFLKMSRLAFGQSKMLDKPIVGLLHLIVYVAFILINIELLEIVLDGFTGKHRVLAPFLGAFYNFLIGFFEVLALLVIISVLIFWIRRNFLKIKRFVSKDLTGWPKNDADYILFIELLLMMLFLNMNATDSILQNASYSDLYQSYGYFPVSQFFIPIYEGFSLETIHIIERTSWWMHILGISVSYTHLTLPTNREV